MHTVRWKHITDGRMAETHPSFLMAERRVMELDAINEAQNSILELEWHGHDGKIIQRWKQ